ncbi:MAG: LysR substrate-binding domain-containing protein [Ferrovibrio sp.]|uniref:LysR substrate-binding domain-containing protein n=1 Tax=Ferrovibrio sp. TaxID=1917215 RepID=UPI00260D5D62|nr:LysR substrate-binding domain-containing protein [Ferrovibrio sp.]MCW0232666.1 LysR substrate-binding domain-containing protein [Ferrovibrio sp.]
MNSIHTTGMRPLPPFDSLVAFEAVLRHGSMTAAAAELGVTQSAVSHRLRRLEGFVGVALLLRRRAGLVPTPAGAALAVGLGEIFDGMAGLRERCRSAARPARLRVGLGAALAHHWLVRRLPAFAARHPGIEIELVIFTTRAQAEARGGDLDLRILWVRPDEARNASTQRLLFREQVFPVCAPAVLKKPLRDAAQLGSLPLLYKSAETSLGEAKQGAEWEWSTWFRRLGITAKPKPRLRFEEIGTAIAAALEGAGVALGRSLLVHDALSDGRLVRPLGPEWSLPSSKVHLARWPAALSGDLRLRAFVAWLAAEAEQTVAAAAAESAPPAAAPAKLRVRKA